MIYVLFDLIWFDSCSQSTRLDYAEGNSYEEKYTTLNVKSQKKEVKTKV